MDKQIAEKRKEAKGKGKRKDIPIRMQSSKQGEIRKPSSVITAKLLTKGICNMLTNNHEVYLQEMWESLKGTTDGHQRLVKWVGLVFISYLLMRICKQHQQKLWGFFSHWIPSLKRITEFSPGDIFRDQLDQHHLLSSFISHFVYPFTSMDRSLHLKFSKHINTGVGLGSI